MNKNYIVTKSNKLICANYDLSLQEQKIILTLASMVQPGDTEFKEYELKIKDFTKLLGVKDDKKYSEIPKTTKNLMKKVFEIKEGSDIVQLAWLSSVRYKTKEGRVILKFSPDLKPYMLQLKELYTSYRLENVLTLKSKYSIRLYEILKSNSFKRQMEIPLEELKLMVGANEKSYSTYANFKNKVLSKAIEELQEKTDITFDFEEIKTGRKVTSIKFFIKANSKEEISATIVDKKELEMSDEVIESGISKVMDIMKSSNITKAEGKIIYNSGKGNIELISKCYEYVKTKKVDNLVGYMISLLVSGFNEPKKSSKKDNFSTYEGQRNYDFEELEKRLLGWDKE